MTESPSQQRISLSSLVNSGRGSEPLKQHRQHVVKFLSMCHELTVTNGEMRDETYDEVGCKCVSSKTTDIAISNSSFIVKSDVM